jgi:hypothetical protein
LAVDEIDTATVDVIFVSMRSQRWDGRAPARCRALRLAGSLAPRFRLA